MNSEHPERVASCAVEERAASLTTSEGSASPAIIVREAEKFAVAFPRRSSNQKKNSDHTHFFALV